jgi:hypothetical protein
MSWDDDALSAPREGSLFADPRADRWAVPVAFALAWPLNAVGLGLIPILFYHEFGHAMAAWLCGRWAFAIPIAGLTFHGRERSWIVTAGLVSALGWLLKRSWEEEDYGQLVVSTAGLLAMADLAFLVPTKEQEAFIIYGGCAGELFLAALVVVAFYWRVAPRLRWDFWRYPLLLTATCTFLHRAAFWGEAAAAPDQRMMGEKIATSRESDQDWVRLVKDHGWTSQEIADRYVALARACGGAIALHYLWFALVGRRIIRDDEERA